MTSNARVVVIGAGLAGVTLARRLAELGTQALVVGDEEHPPYNRVLLAEVLAGRYGPEVIALPAPAELARGRVTAIDRAARTVHCADGTSIGYGTLVLATGSNPVLPALPGLFARGRGLPEGVHAFRTLDDCLRLSAAVRPGCGRWSSAAGCSVCPRPAPWRCAAPRCSSPSRPGGSWNASSTRTRPRWSNGI